MNSKTSHEPQTRMRTRADDIPAKVGPKKEIRPLVPGFSSRCIGLTLAQIRACDVTSMIHRRFQFVFPGPRQ